MKNEYLFSSPIGDQTFVIVSYLKRYLPNKKIQLTRSLNQYEFSENNYLSEETNKFTGIYIPTGANDTALFLNNGDIKIGDSTLKKEALQVYDKKWILGKANELNIPIPTTWDFPPNTPESYPIFYKQKKESGGGVRGIANNFSSVQKELTKELIFQEYISSKGTYGVSFIAKNGLIICSHTHYESESLPKTGGSAILIEEIHEKKIYQYTANLLKHINYSGWGLAEYKFCHKRNDYVFMEINAKFWASCELAFINQPKFLKILFGINSTGKKTKKILFADRALSRLMVLTVIKHLFSTDTTVRLYPQWYKVIAANLTSKKIRQSLKKLF